jgi:hypothetical protein
MKQSELILIFGRICSGKSSFQSQAHRIVVSDIVRELINSNDRTQLQNTQHLDQQIAERILKRVEDYHYLMANDLIKVHNIVVDGIRQSSIVEYLLKHFPEAELVWLEVPTEVRKRRYEIRNADKDTESFDIADNKPIELEGQKIFSIFEERLQILHNY